jgi:hypothetical protein
VVRGANKEYKAFYRHLFPSYHLGLQVNLEDLIDDIRRERFKAEHPCVIYQPKQSGILRPLALLSLRDLIVYQALMNYIAVRFERQQSTYALTRSFGSLFAGKTSPFFYRSWKVCYREYNRALTAAYKFGNNYVADFDLVSFYELIDHNLLRKCLSRRVRTPEILDLLFDCLNEWTTDRAGAHIHHGVPQGPEPSAFLADCFLFYFDAFKFKNVHYFRYVDDIKLMAKDEVPLRRALLGLDLRSKALGLVPQAQKIECRKVRSLREALKAIPSGLLSAVASGPAKKDTQRRLRSMFRRSLLRKGRGYIIGDVTGFRFALARLKPHRHVLRRIAPLLVKHPYCSGVLANYVRKFPRNRFAADILLNALRRDPTYDAVAADYISAMDVCEPPVRYTPYRRVIHTANRRSEEKSIQLRIASLTFRARRMTAVKAAALIARQRDLRVRGALIHRLFGDALSAPFRATACWNLLEREISSADPDLARYVAGLMVPFWPWRQPAWRPPRSANRSVKLLLLALGMRRRAPRKLGVLDAFFKEKMRISIPITWRKALGRDWRDAEHRCVRLQKLEVGDPGAWVLMLDTFNEVLLHAFSKQHPNLRGRFVQLSGTSHHPDLGVWVKEPSLAQVLSRQIRWWRDVHIARRQADLAHAKAKKTGVRTKPVSFKKADALRKRARAAWAEIIAEWKKLL